MPGKIEGSVVSITDSGSIVTDLTADRLRTVPNDEHTVVRCEEHETMGIYPAEHGQPAATFVAYVGESGRLQLEVVGEDTSMMLGIRVGNKVVVQW